MVCIRNTHPKYPKAFVMIKYNLHNKSFKFTYMPVLQNIVQKSYDLAASLVLFPNESQHHEALNRGYAVVAEFKAYNNVQKSLSNTVICKFQIHK
jgi:hypothetical protein